MTDYHCHLLPCIDDGPSSLAESIEMARLLSRAGYHTIYCTPHLIKGLYEADNNTVKKGVADLQEALNREGIDLKLLCGREYFLDNNFIDYMHDLMPLEGTSYLLIEIPPHTYTGMVQDTLTAIIRHNLIPLIAHPERCELFREPQITDQPRKVSRLKNLLQRSNALRQPAITQESNDNRMLNWLIEKRCAFQGNLPSFNGVYGEQVQSTAKYLESLGIYTHSGTDAHTPESLEKLFGINPQ
jgi:protein-tyrosine phosphatase